MLEIILLLMLGAACMVLSVYITIKFFIDKDEK